jgi:uncharacterized lipoprotein YddW (UPF0748 family)
MFILKKLKFYLFLIIFIFAAGCASAADTPAFTTADALLILRAAAELTELTPEQTEKFGINADEKPTSTDALRLLRIISGLPLGQAQTQTPPPEPLPEPPATPPPPPEAHDEVVGVWISFIELQTAFAANSENPEESFRTNFAEMMENCKNLGINTVFVHVRGHGDAYYKSELFPWARQITGTIGSDPGFDPLRIMIEEARVRNISFRAWLNPMRLMSDADIRAVSASHPDLPVSRWYRGSENGTHIVQVDGHWYLNPAYADVRTLIAHGAAEILANYDVDGIHIDDYFYPPNIGASFDSAAFAAGSFTDLAAFRLDNTTQMVQQLYNTVKNAGKTALFGISPQGNIQNCYDIYADVRKWASQAGYCDYIAPQLYYGFLNAAQPFERCLNEWGDLVRGTDIKLIIGLASYKLGLADNWAGEAGRNEWITDRDTIIERQIELSRRAANYGGHIFFSYRFII